MKHYLFLVAVLSFYSSSCGGGPCGQTANKLSGSVSEFYDIETDQVIAKKIESEEALTVEYRHGSDIVTKVVANIRSASRGTKIPLSNGDVYRVTSPSTDFPSKIESGTLQLESDVTVGKEVSGCFNTVFLKEDGSKRTLEGAFQTVLMGI